MLEPSIYMYFGTSVAALEFANRNRKTLTTNSEKSQVIDCEMSGKTILSYVVELAIAAQALLCLQFDDSGMFVECFLFNMESRNGKGWVIRVAFPSKLNSLRPSLSRLLVKGTENCSRAVFLSGSHNRQCRFRRCQRGWMVPRSIHFLQTGLATREVGCAPVMAERPPGPDAIEQACASCQAEQGKK